MGRYFDEASEKRGAAERGHGYRWGSAKVERGYREHRQKVGGITLLLI